MPSPLYSCSGCQTPLDVSRLRPGGRFRCPKCGTQIQTRGNDVETALQVEPISPRPVARAERRMRREQDVAEVVALPKKSNSSLGLFLAVGGCLGLLVLLIIGGGVGAVLYFSTAKDSTPSSSPTVAEAPAARQVPVAQLNPNQPPEKPLPPPQEPIKPLAPQQGADKQGGVLPLKELKAASVYIKAETPTLQARGSGFVVRAQGDLAFVVTNHHVISPPVDQGGGPLPPFVIPRVPGPRIPQPPFNPRMPRPPVINPRIPRRGVAFQQPGGHSAELTVIFYSGTAKEQAVRAMLLREDANADLAILQVRGVREMPRPIDYQIAPELIETMSAIAFGYPFGEKLDPNGKNPAVTVTKGAVSSLRTKGDELAEVQLDLDLNPGNSGGPVVDEKGALIGVAVAKVKNSRIGFAVPVHKLKRLLQGVQPVEQAEPPPRPEFDPFAPALPGGQPAAQQPAQPVNPLPTGPIKRAEMTKLLADLKSPDVIPRHGAASRLLRTPPHRLRKDDRRALQELLTDKDSEVRKAAAQALATGDRKEAAPLLAKLLADDAADVRVTVLNAMKNLKDARVAEALAARLPIDPVLAMLALKAIGPAAEKAVLPYLEEKHAGPGRFWAFDVLEEIGTAASLPALEAVQGPDKLRADRTLEALRQRLPLKADEWTQALDDLKSGDASIRTRATRRLAATPPFDERRADAVSRLEWLLNDQSSEVRIAAAKGLAWWNGPKAVPMLAKRLEGFDPSYHAVLFDLLAELNGNEAAAAIARRLLDVHDNQRAAQALKTMDSRAAEKAVLPLLAENNVFARKAASEVLMEVGGRDSIAPLEKLAKRSDIFYSRAATEALEIIKDSLEDDAVK